MKNIRDNLVHCHFTTKGLSKEYDGMRQSYLKLNAPVGLVHIAGVVSSELLVEVHAA